MRKLKFIITEWHVYASLVRVITCHLFDNKAVIWISTDLLLIEPMGKKFSEHYSDVIMGGTASQITSLAIVYSTVYTGAGQRKHQSSTSLAFERGIHRWPVNSLHKWPVTRKIFPFDDVIMICVKIFIQEDALENVLCQMAAILSRSQSVKWYDRNLS